ncbi:MAG: FtsK/SpoIIIE domain-containing protein [Jatrophihabitans sp.]|uniref:FtsK/SpoIIIE domain-containing protein n=1 Tax=Jatrophihabitans sp. TaxID=1932789 RepID=UPI003F7E256F
MRVVLTVAATAWGRVADVVLEADATTPVAEVARRVADLFAAGGGAVVALDASARRGGAPTLYVDGRPLAPDCPLAESALVDGVVVGLDDPGVSLVAEPEGVAEIRVVAGPGAGTVHVAPPGTLVVGADPSCPLHLPDAGLPPVAATLEVDRHGEVTVLAAPGAAALLDRAELGDRPVAWQPGAELQLGPVLLEVSRPTPPDAAVERSADGPWLDYNRPPRLLPPERQTAFRLPRRPVPPRGGGIPILGALAPTVLGVVMAVVMANPVYLVMAAMTPLMLAGNAISSRRMGKRSHRLQLKEYHATLAAIEADAAAAVGAERAARRAANPDAANLLLIATGPRARLWERRRSSPDHLTVRVGTADLPSEVVVEDPDELEHRRYVERLALDVPVALSLREAGVIGVAGRPELTRTLGPWLVGQLAVLQSPRDVQFVVLTDREGADAWRWAAWLPHCRPQQGQDTVALLGTDTETVARRVAELTAVLSARRAAVARREVVADPDIVVVLDGARRLRALPGVVGLLRDGSALGVHAICLDADERLLPEECGAVITAGPAGTASGGGLRVQQQHADTVDGVRPDLVPAAWYQRVARAMAPVRDVSDADDDAVLPSAARLLDVLELEPPTPEAVVGRWTVQPASTAATVGISLDGPFAIDLRRDGPHGLVAGTTGAGKSELLQTLVASLAVANRPDAMTFVLVDYKGGAAFKDCVDLPHTVGMVTDLDTHLVERALTSLSAELTRREHILAGAGAKDIEDYADAAARDRGLAPLPRLLIVIDEFASMARELPDFVTGLVNIAQRGRSLGIHLLLATQRPTGVVSPEIRANTNLRIALRMTDPSESSDVIDAPDAARISKGTPGRAYGRLGPAWLVPFQAGRGGGRRPGTRGAHERREVWAQVLDRDDLGRPPAQPPQRGGAVEQEELTDLAVLVQAIRGADARLGLPPQHSPWLPALPDLLTTDELARIGGVPDGAVPSVPFALEDLPGQQARRVAAIEWSRFGHLFIAGAPRSGRSQALRTIAGMVAAHVSTADVHLYGIDCGNGALLPLTALPHCGAVVQRTQAERATRLITRLKAEVLRRQELLGAGGFADITEQRAAAAPDERLPHLLVLVDRWEGFVPSLGELDGGALTEALWMVLREGASVGVHVVISGDRSLLTGRISALTEDKLVLRLTDRGDFSLVGLNPRKIPEEMPQGRAFRADSGIETHVAVLGADPSGPAQAEQLRVIAAEAAERDRKVPRARRPFRVDVLPSRLPFAEAWTMRADDVKRPLWGLVGVGGDELLALGPDLAAGAPTFLVAGPPKSGRSSVLVSMVRSFLEGGAEVVITAPRPSPLRDLAGTPGVRAVLTDDDLTETLLASHLDQGDDPVVLVMDDAELHKEISGKDWLRAFIRSAPDRSRGIVIAGNAADVASGFSGWQIDVKKQRQGALLSPQDLTDGDLIGVRVPRSSIGGQIQPGRALLHLGDNELVAVQVPIG